MIWRLRMVLLLQSRAPVPPPRVFGASDRQVVPPLAAVAATGARLR
jgi:hypothetical protein